MVDKTKYNPENVTEDYFLFQRAEEQYRIRERAYSNGTSTFHCEVLSRAYGNWNPLPATPTFANIECAKEAIEKFRNAVSLVCERIHEV